MNSVYKKACTEVLEIIKYLPEEEYSKIPKEKIEFYIENMDTNYNYQIDLGIDLNEQALSNEAVAILVTIYRDYLATEKQKDTLMRALYQNQQKLEKMKSQNYKYNNVLFENDNILASKDKNIEDIKKKELTKSQEKIWVKLKSFMLRILHIN